MQVVESWTPPSGTLGRLVAEAERRAETLQQGTAALRIAADRQRRVNSLSAALRAAADVRLIAEIKRASPSRGVINSDLRAAARAEAYATGGAAAISVLTEPNHFGGSPDDIRDVRAAVTVPVLKKDFHVHPIQLVEARALGATAVLLIARAVSPAQLRVLMAAAADEDLECVVEIRDEAELDRALGVGADIIGVNNRDLETLVVDRETGARLIPGIPRDKVAIAESGVASRQDIEAVAACGADAVLVGSLLSGATHASEAVRQLVGVARRRRGS